MKYLGEFNPELSKGHERRFALTLDWIEPLLTEKTAVCDFGQGLDTCQFVLAVRRLFPNVRYETTGDADLRYPTGIESQSFDGVILSEIIEHIRDRETDPLDTFVGGGPSHLLREALRVLKPGGWMFLSTPNQSQMGCIWRSARGESPKWNPAHVCEFGWHGIIRLVRDTGFTVERSEAVCVWDDLECPAELAECVMRLCPDVPRGHCTFVLARKPA